MRIAVTGASGVIGRGVVARLLSRGHDVVGLARHRPESWPSSANFVKSDIRDVAGVRRAVTGADVVVHCAWSVDPAAARSVGREINIGGTANVLDAMGQSGTRRIVFVSSPHADGGQAPVSAEARVEEMLARLGAEWVTIRSAIIIGRNVNNWVLRLLASPVWPRFDGLTERRLQVVHSDDALRVLMRAVLDTSIESGPVNLAAPGDLSFAELATALGRPVVRMPAWMGALRRWSIVTELEYLYGAPLMDTSRLRDAWGLTPAWNADECARDFALAVRGRVTLGKRVVSLPWRLTTVQDIPAVDAPAVDGTVPVLAGPQGGNGEFDTPIDPRFPTFLATNLSEALPGPFSPSSASVAVRGLRAAGVGIAERLRPGGLIQREIATRTVGVFAHRLYGGITAAYFMAETVPFVKPAAVISNSQFFGPSFPELPIFGPQLLERDCSRGPRLLRAIRNIGVFGINLIGLSAGTGRDTRDYTADIDRLERLAGDDLRQMDERRLLSLILLARDHVVHGWVLAGGGSFMLFAAFSVILRGLGGRNITPSAGPDLVSARLLGALHRLVAAAQHDPNVARVLAEPGRRLDALAEQVPEFHAAVLAELTLIGHRGPAEVEMLSTTYSDDPELLIRMVAKSLNSSTMVQPRHPSIPVQARPVAVLAVRQLRDREVRRDKMVRAIWVLRRLLREYGRRLVGSGAFETPDDVFYLLVDELDALPANPTEIVLQRRTERQRLAGIVPPAVISGAWQSATTLATVLTPGDTLRGLGVCGGRVRGRVRIIRPETIDDLEPGEILVAEVTDVGYTAAFSYAAAAITELGGPMSHAAVVAREFGFPCVVDVHGATRRLPPGALVEVDGSTGEIRVLELASNDNAVAGHRD
ncbi:PEP-utilizing enzyme [Candidatus Mycobacterium methanotrophicum]|uniref:PEP-utilizing enzyme n=1 Tax=Candidatus Mycobacterium methanotrophicum TaxID=2943498 RepID=A0ABY4QHZ2_9MYCO|nr:PEP-utilizing enzyme [Candidatus Mycobacterium methanotrophicum]UQX09426.1 PEP-utilizing enzyme [Candidatus Mycobacterium methanotrophicum]